MILRLTAVVLSLLLLAAHFLRSGNTVIVVILVLCIGLIAVRRPWSVRIIQGVLILGAVEWLLTLSSILVRRMEMDQPYLRMVAIIGSVAALTALSALVFRNDRLRKRYGLDRDETIGSGEDGTQETPGDDLAP